MAVEEMPVLSPFSSPEFLNIEKHSFDLLCRFSEDWLINWIHEQLREVIN